MINVIEVLVQMASDAKLSNTSSFNKMLVDANLTKAQVHAFKAQDMDSLKEATYNLPKIKCYPVLLPEDKNDEVSILINRVVVNF